MMNEEFAPAKVNLTLHITGQRNDGYHVLDSLVVFADVGDVLSVKPARELTLQIDGAFGAGLLPDEDNLVLRAAKMMAGGGAALRLEKNLPIASGIGGGSADAAAALRLLARHWSVQIPSQKQTLQLGADVPVCLHGKPMRMRGIGDELDPIEALPECYVVLINSGVAVSTPAIFKSLTRRENPAMGPVPRFDDFESFIAWLGQQRNDMQSAAQAIAPEISSVLRVLEGIRTCALARMSGSGATCFGLFATQNAADQAAAQIQVLYPDWWVKSAALLS